MSRYMEDNPAYRAVIVVDSIRLNHRGLTVGYRGIDYLGPYVNIGTAKGQVTRQRKERGKDFVDGWVEESTGWEKVE